MPSGMSMVLTAPGESWSGWTGHPDRWPRCIGRFKKHGCGVWPCTPVMAWEHPQFYGGPNGWVVGMDPSGDTDQILASAADAEVTRLGEEAVQGQDVEFTCEAVEGHPAEALLLTAKDAAALVVGSRGHGGFVGALLGSVSQHVAAHASCPVVLIPDPEREAIRS